MIDFSQDDLEAGEAHYGYRSLPLQLADRARRFSLTLLSDVRPASQREQVLGGDMITAINGVPVEKVSDLLVYIETEAEVGQTVELTIIRDGETYSVPVTLGEAR